MMHILLLKYGLHVTFFISSKTWTFFRNRHCRKMNGLSFADFENTSFDSLYSPAFSGTRNGWNTTNPSDLHI